MPAPLTPKERRDMMVPPPPGNIKQGDVEEPAHLAPKPVEPFVPTDEQTYPKR